MSRRKIEWLLTEQRGDVHAAEINTIFHNFLPLSLKMATKVEMCIRDRSKYGRKNTVLASMAVTVVGMFLPLLVYSSVTCVIAYVLLGIGNAILQILSLIHILWNG